MKTAGLDVLPGKIHKLLPQQLCPECGAVMVEEDRLTENGAIYFWYRCGRNGCDGSWLKKLQQK